VTNIDTLQHGRPPDLGYLLEANPQSCPGQINLNFVYEAIKSMQITLIYTEFNLDTVMKYYLPARCRKAFTNTCKGGSFRFIGHREAQQQAS